MLYSASSCFSSPSRRRQVPFEVAAQPRASPGNAGTRRAEATARAHTEQADRQSAPRSHPSCPPPGRRRAAARHPTTEIARGTGVPRPCRSHEIRQRLAPASARARTAVRRDAGNTSVIENGRPLLPNSASCRSGSSDASLLVGWLLGQFGVGPEAFERSEFGWIRSHGRRGEAVSIPLTSWTSLARHGSSPSRLASGCGCSA